MVEEVHLRCGLDLRDDQQIEPRPRAFEQCSDILETPARADGVDADRDRRRRPLEVRDRLDHEPPRLVLALRRDRVLEVEHDDVGREAGSLREHALLASGNRQDRAAEAHRRMIAAVRAPSLRSRRATGDRAGRHHARARRRDRQRREREPARRRGRRRRHPSRRRPGDPRRVPRARRLRDRRRQGDDRGRPGRALRAPRRRARLARRRPRRAGPARTLLPPRPRARARPRVPVDRLPRDLDGHLRLSGRPGRRGGAHRHPRARDRARSSSCGSSVTPSASLQAVEAARARLA